MFLGFPDQALVKSREMLSLSRQLAHPYTLSYALNFAIITHQRCRMIEQMRVLAEEQIAIATEHGFVQWWANGNGLRGWALSEQGEVDAGLAQLRKGFTAHLATKAELSLPSWHLMLAIAYRNRGNITGALMNAEEALRYIQRTSERRMESEAYRIKGELVLLQAMFNAHQAEACFQQALHIACQQQAKSLELRAATSLAKLWRRQGKRQDAYNLLTPVYGWFTEGFDTGDLIDAKALQAKLEEGR